MPQVSPSPPAAPVGQPTPAASPGAAQPRQASTTGQTKPVPTLFDRLHEYRNEAIGITGLILTILGIAVSTNNPLTRRWRAWREAARRRQASSAQFSTFTQHGQDKTFEEELPFFVNNDVEMLPPDVASGDWQPTAGTGGGLRYFLDAFLAARPDGPHRAYLLQGPTGIGKTTFLWRLYRQYQAESKGRDALNLLLYRMGRKEADNFHQQLATRIADGTSRSTILLFDGLDEFRNPGDYAAFTKGFTAFWTTFQQQIPAFNQVVVAVREQFFQSWREESGMLADDNAFVRVRLRPFGAETRRRYFLNRYRLPAQQPDQAGLLDLDLYLTKQARAQGQQPFSENPLLLPHLKTIWDAQGGAIGHGGRRVEGHRLISTLVDAWLKREVSNPEERKHLRRFCQRLALHIARKDPAGRSGSTTATLTADELLRLEDDANIVGTLYTLKDRSLLVRDAADEETGAYTYKFIHEHFLDYFLAQAAHTLLAQLPVAERPAAEQALPFGQRWFAIELFMEQRWAERHHLHRPAVPIGWQAAEFNALALAELSRWMAYFRSFTCNAAAQKWFRQHWPLFPARLIRREANKPAPDWRDAPEYAGLKNLALVPDNFWDKRTNTPHPEAWEAFGYLQDFVTAVVLGFSTLSKEIDLSKADMQFIKHFKNLSILIINNTNFNPVNLPLSCLPKLTQLGLKGILLSQAPPEVQDSLRADLARNQHLTSLNLSDTGLDWTALPLACLSKLHFLGLSGVRLDQAPAEIRDVVQANLAQNQRLTVLNLNNTGLDAAYLPLACLPKLTTLGIQSIRLDQASSEVQKSFRAGLMQNQRLTSLNLNDTGLDVTVLPLACLSQLTVLGLEGICLARASPEVREGLRAGLTQNRLLTVLNLDNTELTPELLAWFAHAGPTLKWLSMEGNPAITEAAFECFADPEHRARIMQSAIDNGWRPEATGAAQTFATPTPSGKIPTFNYFNPTEV